jgi:NAD(P)-dependent dehydrogenase (short-subunit alcohol dehydrogenase family)
MNSFSLPSGFHAVVIGGAGDIGAAISDLFCELGATVTATAVDDAAISRSKLRSRAGLTMQPLDITNDAAVEAFRENSRARRCADQLRGHSRARQGI